MTNHLPFLNQTILPRILAVGAVRQELSIKGNDDSIAGRIFFFVHVDFKVDSTHNSVAITEFFVDDFLNSRAVSVEYFVQSIKDRINVSYIWMLCKYSYIVVRYS